MLLLITVPKSLQVRLHSDDTAATAKAHDYLRARMHALLGYAVDHEQDASALAAAIMSGITDADRVALAALGFSGVAVVQVFESEQPAKSKAWCCTIGCGMDAVYSVTDPAEPYDVAEMHTCAEHLAETCDGVPGAVVMKLG